MLKQKKNDEFDLAVHVGETDIPFSLARWGYQVEKFIFSLERSRWTFSMDTQIGKTLEQYMCGLYKLRNDTCVLDHRNIIFEQQPKEEILHTESKKEKTKFNFLLVFSSLSSDK